MTIPILSNRTGSTEKRMLLAKNCIYCINFFFFDCIICIKNIIYEYKLLVPIDHRIEIQSIYIYSK